MADVQITSSLPVRTPRRGMGKIHKALFRSALGIAAVGSLLFLGAALLNGRASGGAAEHRGPKFEKRAESATSAQDGAVSTSISEDDRLEIAAVAASSVSLDEYLKTPTTIDFNGRPSAYTTTFDFGFSLNHVSGVAASQTLAAAQGAGGSADVATRSATLATTEGARPVNGLQAEFPVPAVPEPSTWIMMILGFAAVAVMHGRRRLA